MKGTFWIAMAIIYVGALIDKPLVWVPCYIAGYGLLIISGVVTFRAWLRKPTRPAAGD